MEGHDYAVIILGFIGLLCCTFLIGKNCDYQHIEDMKRIELNCPRYQPSPSPSESPKCPH